MYNEKMKEIANLKENTRENIAILDKTVENMKRIQQELLSLGIKNNNQFNRLFNLIEARKSDMRNNLETELSNLITTSVHEDIHGDYAGNTPIFTSLLTDVCWPEPRFSRVFLQKELLEWELSCPFTFEISIVVTPRYREHILQLCDILGIEACVAHNGNCRVHIRGKDLSRLSKDRTVLVDTLSEIPTADLLCTDVNTESYFGNIHLTCEPRPYRGTSNEL